MSASSHSPPRPGLFAYKTEPRYGGAVALDWFDPDPDAAEMSAELWTGFWAPGWSHVASVTGSDGRPILLQYDRTSGALGLAGIRDDGQGTTTLASRPADPQAAGTDRLVALAARPTGDASVLTYRKDGTSRLVTAGTEIGLGDPCPAPGGLDDLTLICESLVGRAAEDGRTVLCDLDPEGRLVPVWQENWAPGWSLQVALTTPGQGLFSYRADDGAWALRAIASDGSRLVAEGAWRPGWTVLLAFSMSGWAHVLAYDAASGEVEILRFPEAGDPGRTAVVWRFHWSPGWDVQVPLIWGEELS